MAAGMETDGARTDTGAGGAAGEADGGAPADSRLDSPHIDEGQIGLGN